MAFGIPRVKFGGPPPPPLPFDQERLRDMQFRQMFAPEKMVGTTPYVPEPEIGGNLRTDPILETPQADAYFRALQEPPPKREKISKWRAVGSLVSRDPAAFRETPHRHKIEDREQKLGEMKSAADVEAKYRGQDVQANRALTQAQIAYYNANTNRANVNSQIGNRAELTSIAAKKQALAEYKALYPDYKLEDPKGGNFTLIDPTGRRQPIVTNVSTGTMTDEDSADVKGWWEVEASAARGASQAANQKAADERDWGAPQTYFDDQGKPVGTFQVNGATGAIRPITVPGGGNLRTTPVGAGGADNPQSNPDRTSGVLLRLSQLRTSHPDVEVEVDYRGMPTSINVKSGRDWLGRGGLTDEQIEEKKRQVGDFLYNGTPIPPKISNPAAPAPRNPRPQGQATTPAPTPTPAPQAGPQALPEGWIRVKNKATGMTGRILLKDFDATKYEKLPLEGQLQVK